jgi:hypothetical protein
MGAPALAPRRAPDPRRAPAPRRAPRRRAAAARRPNRALVSKRGRRPRAMQRRAPIAQPALAGAALIPSAAVRTAGAVRDISDSSLIVRLTRGRGWIAVLCALLGGIVALNVVSLSLNAGSGQVTQQISELERSNSALRAQIAEQLSASSVESAADRLGLAVPRPEEVSYLTANEHDLDRLASLLSADTVLTADPAAPELSAPTPSTPITYTEPAAPAAPSPAPAAAPQPASTPAAPQGSSGGVGL